MFGVLDAEQLAIQETVRRFAREQIAPHAARWDEEGAFPRPLLVGLAELGLTGMTVPDAYDGSALSRLTAAIVYEALASADLSVAVWLSVHNMVAGIVARFGNTAQKQQWLPPLARGTVLGAFCLSESGAGSDPASLATTATRSGDHYILNGTKSWVTSGTEADLFVVMARTGSSAGNSTISAFLVKAGTIGLRPGKVERKMGLHASPTCEIVLDQCRIPATQRLGEEGQGLKIALSALDGGRINIAAAATGTAQAALDIAIGYAKERRQFGHEIAEYQGIQFLLADMAMQIEAARLLTYRAASVLDHQGSATQEASIAKCFATDAAMRVTTDAVQVLGGAGYVRDWPLERFMRDVKVTQIFEGTNQIQRIVIARSLLKSHATN